MREPRMNPAFSLIRVRHDTRHRVSENAHSSVTQYVYTVERRRLSRFLGFHVHFPFSCLQSTVCGESWRSVDNLSVVVVLLAPSLALSDQVS